MKVPQSPLLTLLALAACASSPEAKTGRSVDWLVDHGQYAEAVVRAAALLESEPASVQAQEAHRRATMAWHLSEGRRLTFDGADMEALEAFGRARDLEPLNPVVVSWIEKTRRKLSRTWLDRGLEAQSEQRLDDAQEAFEQSLAFNPEEDESAIGLAAVSLLQAYRETLGEDYYDEGVRAVSDWEYEIARSRFGASSKYRPGDPKPERRVGEVERELSRKRTTQAIVLEADGLHAAARNDYRVALLLDPENAEAEAGLARAREEATADELLLQGRMAILRGEFATARDYLERGKETSLVRKELFDEALAGIDDARAAKTYQKALDLEHDFRYEAAIAKFQELLEGRDYYEDAISRLRTLEDYVSDAAALYARVEESQDPAEQLQLLRQIEVFWPEYRDIRERLQALEAAGA
ncbi:MAG: hypothetical protein O2799_05605 [Planctomycetota bacterium]|nr:hypothetical protein [Planctomycetota bacterium]